MSDRVRINISRVIILIVIFYCSFILYNTKVVSVKEQNENIKKLEKQIKENKEKSAKPVSEVDMSEDDYEIVGALYVPKISLKIAIYNSTDEDAIRRGAGILETTGNLTPKKGQNVIVTTHNGDDKRDLFMNLHKVEVDDIFLTKDSQGNIVKYKVDNIQTVLPTELFDKMIYDKKVSKMTLLTCTPVGINSHRLLVTATEIPYDRKSLEEVAVEMEKSEGITFSNYEKVIIAILVLSLIFLVCTFVTGNKDRKKER